MCGIVGYVGGQDAQDVVVEGLRRLEYRGYDSGGDRAWWPAGSLRGGEARPGRSPTWRRQLAEEARRPPATVGIGHTRWATHGAPTDENAHPHFDQLERVAIIHNGIIENYLDLRGELERAGARPGVRDGHRGRGAPARAGAAGARRGPCRRRCGRSAAGCRGAFTLSSRWTARDADTVVAASGAAHRSWPDAGRGSYFVASDVAAFIAPHP